MNKVELLAPAGSMEAFIGAINAGADAVYLSGMQFGARAYAKNFSNEEIIEALSMAHLRDKKVYLTLNTLMKEDEMSCLYDYLLPLYCNGLDGIILQDLGVMQYVKNTFPLLPIHISTQMSCSNHFTAKRLMELGAKRIIPSRELSLTEIQNIKRECNIEIETFVHGAICYCYSGQCLFSSILGERSGNRGRCAQPCRLNYSIQNKNGYFLSLKDMCTVEMIPELIDAGIQSFKIEGRMKSPAYAAGVTSIYRKYIDLYYQTGNKSQKVDRADLDFLRKLYVRKELGTGYYKVRNGKNMLTIQDPSYLPNDENICKRIEDTYLKGKNSIPITGKVTVKFHQEACLEVSDGKNCVALKYGNVESAQRTPVTEADVAKQIKKTGQTDYVFDNLVCEVEDNCFIQNKDLNELRRNVLDALKEKALRPYKRESVLQAMMPDKTENNKQDITISCEVCSLEQFEAVVGYNCNRIYLDYEFFLSEFEILKKCLSNRKEEIFIALPHIMREDKLRFFDSLSDKMNECAMDIDGILVRDIGEIAYFKEKMPKLKIITDTNIYGMNRMAKTFIQNELSEEMTYPYECNCHELKKIVANNTELIIYSHIPLMITANCIQKTTSDCCHESGILRLKDRYQKEMPVKTYCTNCYNIIYNSIPYSLCDKAELLTSGRIFHFRLVFLQENKKDIQSLFEAIKNPTKEKEVNKYTKGHFNRGVL